MEDQLTGVYDANLANDAPQKVKSSLPYIALGFAFYPILLHLLAGFGRYLGNSLLEELFLVILMVPIPAGLILGIVYFCIERKRTDRKGAIIAIFAIVLQIICILLFVIIMHDAAQVISMY